MEVQFIQSVVITVILIAGLLVVVFLMMKPEKKVNSASETKCQAEPHREIIKPAEISDEIEKNMESDPEPTTPTDKKNAVAMLSKKLSTQITKAVDEVKSGNLEKLELSKRLEGTFTAGYMLAFTHINLDLLFCEEEEKYEYADLIFNSVIPNSGASFIRDRYTMVVQCQEILTQPTHQENRVRAQELCGEFNLGSVAAEDEDYDNPDKLRDYLITGDLMP